jgi:formylglycine-generating enzyme required for sulfatase activity
MAVAGAPQSVPATYHEKIAGTLVGFDMVRIPAGARPSGQQVPEFYLGRTEVTWDLFDVYTLRLDKEAGNPSGADAVARPSEPYGAPDRGWGHAGYPAMSVTRESAEAFCKWLSAKTGKAYRLPTEDEWARAATVATGGATLSSSRRDALAWHSGNAEGRTHPVGTRTADAAGLFDLFGNVAEWVSAGSTRIIAGGSYRDAAARIGPLAREPQDPTWNQTDPQLPKSRWWLSDGPFAGFRLAMSSNAGVRP